MTRPVIWRPLAEDDLRDLYDWIAEHAGLNTAFEYTMSIEQHAAKLAEIPKWGAARPELGPGIRTITYRGRTTIAYRLVDEEVEIVALAHGGRDLGRRFVIDED